MKLQTLEDFDASAAERLAAERARLVQLHAWQALLPVEPDSLGPKGSDSFTYDFTASYRVKNMQEAYAVLAQFRDGFLPISRVDNGCCSITAYQYGSYAGRTPVWVLDDCIELSAKAGERFSATDIIVFPKGVKVCVRIALTNPGHDWLARVAVTRDSRGVVVSCHKYGISAGGLAAKNVDFGGSRDAMDRRYFFQGLESLRKAMEVINEDPR